LRKIAKITDFDNFQKSPKIALFCPKIVQNQILKKHHERPGMAPEDTIKKHHQSCQNRDFAFMVFLSKTGFYKTP